MARKKIARPEDQAEDKVSGRTPRSLDAQIKAWIANIDQEPEVGLRLARRALRGLLVGFDQMGDIEHRIEVAIMIDAIRLWIQDRVVGLEDGDLAPANLTDREIQRVQSAVNRENTGISLRASFADDGRAIDMQKRRQALAGSVFAPAPALRQGRAA